MQNDNINQAIRHWMISVMCRCDKSLDEIKASYIIEHNITKDDFAKALHIARAQRCSGHAEEQNRYATAPGN